jgi:hypothetical protein
MDGDNNAMISSIISHKPIFAPPLSSGSLKLYSIKEGIDDSE